MSSLAACIALAQPAFGQFAKDSRTITLNTGESIRLYDVSTPSATACECNRECILGRELQDFLNRTLATGGAVRVERYGIDHDGTVRGKVFVGNKDLSMILIENGFARPATSLGGGGHWCS
jgi:endonuclease YncB( thermonuclease family)